MTWTVADGRFHTPRPPAHPGLSRVDPPVAKKRHPRRPRHNPATEEPGRGKPAAKPLEPTRSHGRNRFRSITEGLWARFCTATKPAQKQKNTMWRLLWVTAPLSPQRLAANRQRLTAVSLAGTSSWTRSTLTGFRFTRTCAIPRRRGLLILSSPPGGGPDAPFPIRHGKVLHSLRV